METIKQSAKIISNILKDKRIMPEIDLLIYTWLSGKELFRGIGWLTSKNNIHLISDHL